MEFIHKTVFLEEGVKGLDIKPDGIYVDATTGGAGHSALILKQLTTGHLYCLDQDHFALFVAHSKLIPISENFTLIKTNFRHLVDCLKEYGVTKIDGIIYDLGVSSYQLDMPERGFSYRYNAPLDMRMDLDQRVTAEMIISDSDYEELARIFFKYGDETRAKQIAKAIVKAKEKKPIETTMELVNIIKSALPMKVLKTKGHPAKKVFQALRVVVNDELRSLEDSLVDAVEMLNPDGRVVVISFQSLEDKIVKFIFKEFTTVQHLDGLPTMPTTVPLYEMITKKPVVPTPEELKANNRAHSAKMRIIRHK